VKNLNFGRLPHANCHDNIIMIDQISFNIVYFFDATAYTRGPARPWPTDRSIPRRVAGSAVRREMAAARAHGRGDAQLTESNRGHCTLDMQDLVPCGSYRPSGPRDRAQAAPTEASRRAEDAHDETGCAQPRGENELITRQHARAQRGVSERTHARARQPIGMAQ